MNRCMVDDHISLPPDLAACPLSPSILGGLMAPMRDAGQLPHATIDALAQAPGKFLHGRWGLAAGDR